MAEFWENYPEINSEVNKVKEVILKALKTKSPSMSNIIKHLMHSQGKYVRAGIVILSAQNGDYNSDRIVKLAAAIEMVHLATLVHDDIIDDSDTRRGFKSVQSQYGKDTAVYTGDFIFAKAYGLVAGKYDSQIDRFADSIEKICLGEVIQNENKYNKEMNIRKYLRIISGKTAALFGLSMMLGSSESGLGEKESMSMAWSGYFAGMAFQIIDDCLDYSIDTEKLGKNAKIDLLNGLYTLPLLYALQNDKKNEIKDILESKVKEPDMLEISQLVHKLKGLDKSRILADKYSQKALLLLKSKDTASNRIIREVFEKLLIRNY